ncbi:ATP-dependent sacrificial sulfur transferase LarE [Heliobacterium chlorum]|uniref:ATP-dependent sacrificial sulfur transferase LarE n=1 Tax=Heliobacterium chlorum TaxID=2698 RepID=A0ABR7T3U2_HELCL|nr:ATP-dependent sacrificial sulfur transferase LarE [Heliobacterium chlorum]MBC9785432.1 ATP-dependent sacrificial sulfur transferase LarE [Heliobacterium chlorum]
MKLHRHADLPDIQTESLLKYSQLRELLLQIPSALLAFSGGVDSTFLLAAWHDTWVKSQLNESNIPKPDNSPLSITPRMLACTVDSPLLPVGTLDLTVSLVRQIGAEYRVVNMDPLSSTLVSSNPPERCYHCKKMIFQSLKELASAEGLPLVLNGEQVDDHLDFRPGHRALKELGIRSPLAEVGMGKRHVRCLSQMMGLPTWDHPSMACLASRIPYGTPLDPKKLLQVDEAERYLRTLGYDNIRVRHHGEIARIEAGDSMEKFLNAAQTSLMVSKLKSLGFRYVTIDLEGYRTGSLNPVTDK